MTRHVPVAQVWSVVERAPRRDPPDETPRGFVRSATMQHIYQSLQRNIELARIRNCIRVSDLARKIGVSTDDMLAMERGDQFPTASQLRQLQTELGATLMPSTSAPR